MSTYLPTLKQLQYLVALHEHGHFGRAADACFISQSTLSAGLRDLETLLEKADGIKQPKRREALIQNADLIRISKQLVTLKADTPLTETLEDLEVRVPEAEALIGFLNRMEFRTLTRRVADSLKVEAPAPLAADQGTVVAEADPATPAAPRTSTPAPRTTPRRSRQH